ncbi:MAG TPA: hypothetical protein VJN18_00305 [Polyangiaceae bacterium]|nr:hypothetical protein [Polyangiaceae bacterium]
MKRSITQPGPLARRAAGVLTCLAALGVSNQALAQAFNPYTGYPTPSKAGEDGHLDLTGLTSGTQVDFDPRNPLSHERVRNMDADGDNVFHFKSIKIPAGVTLKMSAKWINGPVYFMVQPDPCPAPPAACPHAVEILGAIDMNGEHGHDRTRSTAFRLPAVPGPGGFPGGIGGNHGSGTLLKGPAQPGGGPGGRPRLTNTSWGTPPVPTGNEFLVPLVGGSGGSGGSSDEFAYWGSGGGAGGGALLITSARNIRVMQPGGIFANGGAGGYHVDSNGCPNFLGAGGQGGSIRLVAATLQGNGNIHASHNFGNRNVCNHGSINGIYGTVRLETFLQDHSYSLTPFKTGVPFTSFIPPTAPPAIRVTQIAGQEVRSTPNGSFDNADVTINDLNAVQIVIRATNVPVGTKPILYLLAMDGTDQQIEAPALTADGGPGETVSTIETAQNVKIPSGFTRGYVRASWTAQP